MPQRRKELTAVQNSRICNRLENHTALKDLLTNLNQPTVVLSAILSLFLALLIATYDVQTQNEAVSAHRLAFTNSLNAEVARAKAELRSLCSGRLLFESNKRPDDKILDMQVSNQIGSALLKLNGQSELESKILGAKPETSIADLFAGLPIQLLNGSQLAKGRRDVLRLALSSLDAPLFVSELDGRGRPIITEPFTSQIQVGSLIEKLAANIMKAEVSRILYIYANAELAGKDSKVLILASRVSFPGRNNAEIIAIGLDRENMAVALTERIEGFRGMRMVTQEGVNLFGQPALIRAQSESNTTRIDWVSPQLPLDTYVAAEFLPQSAISSVIASSSKSNRKMLILAFLYLVLVIVPAFQLWASIAENSHFDAIRLEDSRRILRLREQIGNVAQSASECAHDIRNQLQRFNVNREAGAQVLGRIRILQAAIEGKPFSRIPIYAPFFIRMAAAYGDSLSKKYGSRVPIQHRLEISTEAQVAFVLCDPSAVESILINLKTAVAPLIWPPPRASRAFSEL